MAVDRLVLGILDSNFVFCSGFEFGFGLMIPQVRNQGDGGIAMWETRRLGRAAISCVVSVLLLGNAHVFAETGRSAKRDLTESEKLLRWASRISHRPMPADGEIPPLIPMSATAMGQKVCPEQPRRCASLAAAYSIRTGEIYYRASFKMDKAIERSYIVHEMVHFLQHLSYQDEITDSCRRIFRMEREAYGVQAAFLRRHGSMYAGQAMPRSVSCMPEGGNESSEE